MPQRAKKLKELQKKHEYNSYQEDLTFAKELNILRNDFYYQMIDSSHVTLVDFLYQPLDLISGDAYTARRIDNHRTFYLIVDGMGKGLSASLTAMISLPGSMTSSARGILLRVLMPSRLRISLRFSRINDEIIFLLKRSISPVLRENENSPSAYCTSKKRSIPHRLIQRCMRLVPNHPQVLAEAAGEMLNRSKGGRS